MWKGTLTFMDIFVKSDPKSPVSEAYKMLRTRVKYTSVDKKIKTILITSAEPGDGKSTTASNLAEVMMRDKKRVMLIDCDLRKPTIHKLFGLSNKNGLSDLLYDENLNDNDCIQRAEDIDIITAGTIPPDPSELLGSNKMQVLLSSIDNRYDYIIIDAPPVMAVADAQIIAQITDGVIVVVSANKTIKHSLQKCINELREVKARILGTVLNNYDYKSNGYSGYYYYYSNGKKHKRSNNILGRHRRKKRKITKHEKCDEKSSII